MSFRRPRIGIPVDVNDRPHDPFHGVGEKYLAAVAHGATALPLLLPALGAGSDLASLEDDISAEEILDGLDGLFFTGSPSNLAPAYYGGDSPGVPPYDPQRDATTIPLLRAALARDLPILAVCRGFQELNAACGGTICQAVHERADRMDHRDNHDLPREQRYAPAHTVQLTPDGALAQLAGTTEIEVNSLHGQGIETLAPELAIEATAPDGLIEAVRHRTRRFAIGVQWHPEWRFYDNPFSSALFAAFGEAARAGR